MTARAVVEFRDIAKVYSSGLFRKRQVQALRGVSFRVEAGEVFGLLGPNRAGKTTLMKILLSLCRQTSGEVQRFGLPDRDRGTLARIGYMHENQAFPRYLSAAELLRYYGALSLTSDQLVAQRIPKLLEQVGLSDRAREPIAQFSKGMVQRLALAQALINDPELLVLDEPGEGLDLKARQLVHEVIRAHRKQGRTVLITSHITSDIESVCDRVAVLVEGRLKRLAPLAELTSAAANGEKPTLEHALAQIYEGAP